ncbi:MAG TPA: hypothetical protein VND93_10365 [Myxococcales bacterium]|jgi:hypothetical protein|nr:hypothetical protein [Myxococcales bacterium]
MADYQDLGTNLRTLLLGLLGAQPGAEPTAKAAGITTAAGAPEMPADPNLSRLVDASRRVLSEEYQEETVKSLRMPTASRRLGIYMEVEVPALGRTLVFDTRTDNSGKALPELLGMSYGLPDSPWPAPPAPRTRKEVSGGPPITIEG